MSFLQRVNKKTIIIPSLAGLLFVYGVTSIRAAKSNAQRHRNADTGGEGLSLLNESRRRHGMDRKVAGSGNTISELASEARTQILGAKMKDEGEESKPTKSGRSDTEEKLRALQGRTPRSREG